MAEDPGKDQLAAILQKLDEVSRQAQQLSERIHNQMAERWRQDQQAADVRRSEPRRGPRARKSKENRRSSRRD